MDGDLTELTPEVLAQLRGEIKPKDPNVVRESMRANGAKPVVYNSIAKNIAVGNQSREQLREALKYWGGAQMAKGLSQSQSYRKFFLKYGVDVISCQKLTASEMDELTEKLKRDYSRVG